MVEETEALEFKIEGLEGDQGDVRLAVLQEKLSKLNSLTSDAERQVAGVGQAKALYRVVDLSHSSAVLTIQPFSEDNYLGSIGAVRLIKSVLDMLGGKPNENLKVQSSLFKKIQELCSGVGEKFRTQTLRIGESSYSFDSDLSAEAQKYLDRIYRASGTLKGAIERVNIHDRKEFYLYLDRTGESVQCSFRGDDLLATIKESFGGRVIVSGQLEYVGDDSYPSKAFVRSIEIIPQNYKVPGIDEFLGAEPDLTGDKDSGDFIRRVRDGWERH